MKIINKAPESIFDCDLYKLLKIKCDANLTLIEKVNKVIEVSSPLLDLIIAGPFKNYTLHNPNHSKKIVHLAGNIIEDKCKHEISALDIAIIIIVAYLHDLGMSVTAKERNTLIESDLYNDYLQDNGYINERINSLRQKLINTKVDEKNKIEQELYQIQEFVLSEILRKRHASRERYTELIKSLKTISGRQDIFEYDGANFEDILIDICESHNLSAIVLGEFKTPFETRFPRNIAIGGEFVNVQFCAAILRICDILDFDRERTPETLFESIGLTANDLPGAEISLYEWQKHMAVHSINISDEELVISGDCKHPAIEGAITEFSKIIQKEIQDTLAIVRLNNAEISEKYKISIPSIVRTRIKSIGYVYQDLKLHLNPDSIMTLLMGEQLYSSPNVAIRELIQNSIDACKVRAKISNENYIPKITLRKFIDEEKKVWIEVRDNGIGMDNHVITDFLFQVGSSYYKSSEFRKLVNSSYVPISRFGIGLISVFMIADVLKVKTCNQFSPRGDTKEREIIINHKKGLAFIVENNSVNHGTTINIRLKNEYLTNHFFIQLENYLQTTVVRPDVNIDVDINNIFSLTKEYMQLNPFAIKKAENENIKYIVLELNRFSNTIEGYAVFPFANIDGKYSIKLHGQRVFFDENLSINPHNVFVYYPGNRLTVNGFRMGIKKAHRIFGKSLRFAYDINVIGDDEVRYDVARDSLIGRGSTVVKNRIKEAIICGLKETGVYDLLDDETRNFINSSDMFHNYEGKLPDMETIMKIKDNIPYTDWPIGLHHELATKLGLRASEVYRGMSYLLDNDLINDGRKK